jgi:hypothetical protein
MLAASVRLLVRYQKASFGTISMNTTTSRNRVNPLAELLFERYAYMNRLIREKNSEIMRQDMLIEGIREEKDGKSQEIMELRSVNTQLRIDLQEANMAYLRSNAKVCVKGGLDLIINSIWSRYPTLARDDPGLVCFLDNDKNFRNFFTLFLAKKKLTIDDVRQSFASLYKDTKYENGSDWNSVRIYYNKYSPYQVHSLCALFHYFSIKYERFNTLGEKYDDDN